MVLTQSSLKAGSCIIVSFCPPPTTFLAFCVGCLSLTGMEADTGSYSDFQIQSAYDSGANISHTMAVSLMSPVALDTLHKRKMEKCVPHADWKTRRQVSLFLRHT